MIERRREHLDAPLVQLSLNFGIYREASRKLLEVENWSPEGDTVALRNFQF